MGITPDPEAGLPARFPAFELAPGVRITLADRRLVVLDVDRDRYLRIDRRRSMALAAEPASAALALAHEVLAAKGLTRRKPPAPQLSIYASSLGRQCVRFDRIAGVFAACRWADRLLKRERFADVLRSVKRRRAPPRDALANVARTFLICRPFYPRDYACMFDALAMLRYLACRGHGAHWIFGVRGAPFSAHCWLEGEGAVLNDDPDVVASFKPIMAV